MTFEEARSQLDACTLRPGDADAEARALASSDAELKAWLKARAASDEQLSAAFMAQPIPDDLSARLVAAMNAEALAHPAAKKPTQFRVVLPWIALVAAAVVIFGAIGSWLLPRTEPSWQNQALAFVNQIDSGKLRLDKFSGNLEELKGFLPTEKGPAPVHLPKSVTDLHSLGCKVITIGGRTASVICFRITADKEAHLVVINNSGLRHVPPQHKPQFDDHGDWHVASWSDGPQSYLLATQADASALKHLFGLAAVSPYHHVASPNQKLLADR